MADTDQTSEATKQKPVHSLIIDAGPIIRNEPPISTLLSHTNTLFTTPSVIAEIRDPDTRSRFETTWKAFLTTREPQPKSVKAVADFARKTGDYAVLSKTDLGLLGLTYEIEVERNGGDWRLRSTPGQKTLNGAAPEKRRVGGSGVAEADDIGRAKSDSKSAETDKDTKQITSALESTQLFEDHIGEEQQRNRDNADVRTENRHAAMDTQTTPLQLPPDDVQYLEDDSDSEGWITPSNLRKKQVEDADVVPTKSDKQSSTLQAALTTTDFAMQNVCLRMNMNLLASNLQQIRSLKTHVLRCHACFAICREMTKQFCPRCGGPTLTRVSCSTNAAGEFTLHLKKNMQWNNRGNRFSVPKAVHGTPSGKIAHGGGKGGWGQDLILAEDQKEYIKALTTEKRRKDKDLMDQDTLPSILSGDRGQRPGGRIRVGAGRNVNSKKR